MTSSHLLNNIAEAYVKVALALGIYDEDSIDAYFGPEEWQTAVKQNPLSLNTILASATELLSQLQNISSSSLEAEDRRRCSYLIKQLIALSTRAKFLQGIKLSFDEEAQQMYDVLPPVMPENYFQNLLQELEDLFPGREPLSARIEKYRQQFILPPNKTEQLFRTAIAECRARTAAHISLPPYEDFRLEFVRQKPWSGYNWYQGNAVSIIQINVDFPIYLERVIDLAAHEGYPGHHVYNTLMEQECLRKRGWREFSIYLLFSPQSLIAEGTANYGIEVAFPDNERTEYERTVLFPLCSFDPDEAERYAKLQRVSTLLNYAHNEGARNYLDGLWTHDETKEWLITYALLSPERATQRIQFFERYRSYVINYNTGLDLVRRYCEEHQKNSFTRWEVFRTLLTKPVVPSELKA